MFDFLINSGQIHLDPIFKIGFLILVGVYSIFSFMLIYKIRSFNRIVYFSGQTGKIVIQTFSILFLVLLLFLFIITLVIV